MPNEKEMSAGRRIVSRGGQILLPFDVGDASVHFSSRRELARMIDAEIAAAEVRGREIGVSRGLELAAEIIEEQLDDGKGDTSMEGKSIARQIRRLKDKQG